MKAVVADIAAAIDLAASDGRDRGGCRPGHDDGSYEAICNPRSPELNSGRRDSPGQKAEARPYLSS